MYNTTVHIYYRKKKIAALLILILGLLGADILFVCKPMFYDQPAKHSVTSTHNKATRELAPWQAIIFTLLLLLSIYSLLKKLFCKSPALIINCKGITKNNNTIPWSQITDISKLYRRPRRLNSKPAIYISVHRHWSIIIDPDLMSFKNINQESLESIDYKELLQFLNRSLNMRVTTLIHRQQPKY